MTTYVWRDGGFVEKSTGQPMHVRDPNAICAPMVIPDVPEYRSPINGLPITSRSHQREDLKRNNCVLAEPRKPRGFKNPHFARKRGFRTIED
jgi:hypothetical protein